MGFQNFLSAFGNRAARRKAQAAAKRSKPQDLPPLYFETLEPRLMLSATPFTFTANPLVAQNLALGIVDLAGVPTLQLSNASTGVLIQSRAVVDVSTISLTLSGFDDRLTLTSAMTGIPSGTILGQTGNDRILTTTKGVFSITGVNAGTAMGLGFSSIEALSGGASTDSFTLSTVGSLTNGIDGGAGSDTLRLTGGALSVTMSANSSTAASLTVDSGLITRINALSNIEVVSDTSNATTRAVLGSKNAEAMTISQSAGQTRVAINAGLSFLTTGLAGSLSVEENGGQGSVTVTSSLSYGAMALSLGAETISAGLVTISTTDAGSVEMRAIATPSGVGGTIGGVSASVNTALATINLNGTAIASGTVTLRALAEMTTTVSASTLAVGGSNAEVHIALSAANLTALSGSVAILSSSLTNVSVTATPAAGSSSGIDAAVAFAQMRNRTDVSLEDVKISAKDSATIQALHGASVTVLADGLASTASHAGAMTAVAFVDSQTRLILAGTNTIRTGIAVALSADASNIVTTTAKSGTGGASGSAGATRSEQQLASANARTPDGAVTVAAAVALNRVNQSTDVQMKGALELGGLSASIGAHGSQALTASANAGTASGAVAAAVAMNLDTVRDAVQIEGQIFSEGALLLDAGERTSRSSSTVEANATSGASDPKSVGVAGSLALNDLQALRAVALGTDSGLSAKAPVVISVRGATSDRALAKAAVSGSATVGAGASVALNLTDRDSLIHLEDGAALSLSGVTLSAGITTTNNTTTLAEGGTAAGLATSAAFALTAADHDSTLRIGDGDLSAIDKGLVGNILHRETISTTAKGSAFGSTAALGGAVALTVGSQDALVELARGVTSVQTSLTALQVLDVTTLAVAASGGSAAAGSGSATADQQSARATGFAGTETGAALNAPPASTPQGGMGLAAALSIGLQQGTTTARIAKTAGVLGGKTRLVAANDIDATVTADGSVVAGSGTSIGVGAAVALNLATMPAQAEALGKVEGLEMLALSGDAFDSSSPGRSLLTTKAVAGAGASRFGLAGSFALTSENLDARVVLAGSATALTQEASTSVTIDTLATADTSLGQGPGKPGGVGLGLGFALSLAGGQAQALVEGDADTGSELSMTAKSDRKITTRAQAGVAGAGVALTPSVALTISDTVARVDLPLGGGLNLARASFVAATKVEATTTAASAAAGTTAAAGMSFALTSLEDRASVVLARAITALGDVTATASLILDGTTGAEASAAGVTRPAGSADTADGQMQGVTDFARGQGSTTAGTQPSAQGAEGKFGLAAALALGFLGGSSTVQVLGAIQSDGAVTLRALADVDGQTTADGSVVVSSATERPLVGLGAALAMTQATTTILASVETSVQATGALLVEAAMADDLSETMTDQISTRAVAGVGSGDLGTSTAALTGAFALTRGNVDATARLGSTGSLSGGAVTMGAARKTDLAATATADATNTPGRGMGIGAGLALVLADIDAQTLVPTGAQVTASGALTLRSDSETFVNGEAHAGAKGGKIAISPSVLIVSATGSALTSVETGAAIGAGTADLTARSALSVTGASGAAAEGASAALGVSVAILVDAQTAVVSVARAVTATGDILVLATLLSDGAMTATASAKGVGDTTTGTGSSNSTGQMNAQLGFANGLQGTGATAPASRGPSGQFGLAASLALSVASGLVQAGVRESGSLTSTSGSVTVEAKSDTDLASGADSSVVKGNASSDPAIGVGAAVAITLGNRLTQALVEGTVSAAKQARIASGMATDVSSANVSFLTANAISGVGATKVAISGAFAMVQDSLTAAASPGVLAVISGGAGMEFEASSVSAAAAGASADGALGAGGGGLGIGAAVAIVVSNGAALAEVAGSVGLSGGGLRLAATSERGMAASASAGGTAGAVGVAPAVALIVGTARTRASLGAGTALSLDGSVTIEAKSFSSAALVVNSAGTGSTAGLGVSFGLAVLNDDSFAATSRAITATGSIAVLASQRTAVVELVVASAGGVSAATSGVSTASADAQMSQQHAFARTLGAPAASLPSADTSGGKFGLAAAVALSLVTGRVEARVDGAAPLVSTLGEISVRALSDVDSNISADASLVADTASRPDVGVGAAVALNLASRTATARVLSDLVGAGGVTVEAGMAPDPSVVNRSTFVARAISGVGAGNVAVGGAFAMNRINLDAVPVLADGITLNGGEKPLVILADTRVSATVQATANTKLGAAGTASTKVGVGAAFAYNFLDSDALVQPPANVVLLGSEVTLSANSETAAVQAAQSGVNAGTVTVAPAMALVTATNSALVLLSGATELALPGDLTLRATERTATIGSSSSMVSASNVAVGASVSLAVMENSASAILDRPILAAGAVTVSAARQTGVALTATALAAGATTASTGGAASGDAQVARELGFLNAAGGTTGAASPLAAPDANGTSQGVGIAAALALSIVTGGAAAEISSAAPVTAAGRVTVAARSDTDSSATADAKVVGTTKSAVGVGAAIAVNILPATTLATVKGPISSDGLTILAGGLETDAAPVNTVSARAISGAGARTVGVSGAFALNLQTLRAQALLLAPTIQTGDLAITAKMGSNTTAIASSMTVNQGGAATSSSTSVGIGLSFALNVIQNDILAQVADGVTITGGRNVSVQAENDMTSLTKAKAGSTASVGVSPSLALLVSGSSALAQLGSGNGLSVTGAYLALARQSHRATLEADASALSDRAGVGAAVALAILPERALALTGRDIDARGDITISADLLANVASLAKASTSGVTPGSSGPATSNAQSTALTGFADRLSGQTTAPTTGAQAGGASGSQSVGVAAALALNIVTARAESLLLPGLKLSSGGNVALKSAMDLDANANGDGSTARTTVGVGVGVGMNIVSGNNEARVDGVIFAAGTVTVSALMSPQGNGMSLLSASATAGAGKSTVGVAGAFALNLSSITATARQTGEVGAGGVVTYAAENRTRAVATAKAATSPDPGQSGTVGVGAGIALNILDDDTLAEITDAAPLSAGGLVMTATATHTADASARAGTGGDVSISPALALNVVSNQTLARFGAGSLLTTPGAVSITTSHLGTYVARADAEAGGANVAVGAAIGITIVTDSASAVLARSLAAGGAVTVQSASKMIGSATAKGGAKGNSSSSNADTQANQAVNNNATVTSNAGSQTLPKAQDGMNQGNGAAQSATGRTGGAVGVGAGIAVNTMVTESRAEILSGLSVTSGGDIALRSTLELDGGAEATGTAMVLQSTVAVGAAVALNVVSAGNLAVVGAGVSLDAAGGIEVSALHPVPEKGTSTNDVFARAFAGGGADKVGVAGSVAINITTFEALAQLGDGSVSKARGGPTQVRAVSNWTAQNVAAAGAFGQSVGVGAGVVVNVVTLGGHANVLGDSLDSAGAVTIAARTTYVPKEIKLLAGVDYAMTSVAMGGAVTTGSAGVGGSVVVDVINADTAAIVAPDAQINQAAGFGNVSVLVDAQQQLTVRSGAGGFGGAVGSAGIGAGITVGVINDTVRAEIGDRAKVGSEGGIAVTAGAGVERIGVAGSFGLAGTVGVGGSVLVDVLNSRTTARVGANAGIQSRGLTIDARDADRMEHVVGAVGGAGTVGVGLAAATVTHNDTVEALLAEGAKVLTSGGLRVIANSTEDLSMITVAGAGGATAGVAASPAVTVLTETTTALIGTGADIVATAGLLDGFDLRIEAADATKSFKLAGALAFGGSAGVGAGLDTTRLTKRTDAILSAASRVLAEGSVEIRAFSDEDLTSFTMAGSGGGVAVSGAVGVVVSDLQTRAFIEGTAADAPVKTRVDAAANVIVEALGQTEYDLFAGGVAISGSASVGASALVPIVTKRTEAFIGAFADVTARALGGLGRTLDGSFAETLGDPEKDRMDVAVKGAGGGSLGLGGGQGEKPVSDTNGTVVDGTYAGNSKTGFVLHLTPSTTTVRGVSVMAVASDDLATMAINGGVSGGVAVNLSGDVGVVGLTTLARIDQGARINKAAGAEGLGQDVLVLASSKLVMLSVAGAASGAGTVAVAPSVAVGVVTLATEAKVARDADIEARDSFYLGAKSSQEITSYVVGLAVSSTVAVGGSVAVLVLNSTTSAHFGEVNAAGDRGARLFAGRDAAIQAIDDTRIVTIEGAVAGSQVGVGASVGVSSITKRTTAQIAGGSTVVVMGDASGGQGLVSMPMDRRFDGAKGLAGLYVQAGSQESIDSIGIAGGIGVYVGASGGVSIALIDSDTVARIGAAALVNQGTPGGSLQSVHVEALNRVTATTASGAFGGGAAGLAGALTVGILRNATLAEIADGARVHAGGSVTVDAQSAQDITSVAASGALGGVAGALSMAIWAIGGDFSAGGAEAEETAWTSQYQKALNGNEAVLGGNKRITFSVSDVNATANTIALSPTRQGLKTGDAVIYRSTGAAVPGLVSGRVYYVVVVGKTIGLSTRPGGPLVNLGAGLPLASHSLELADTSASNAVVSTARSRIIASARPDLADSLASTPAGEGTTARIGAAVTLTALGGVRVQADDDLDFTQVSGNVVIGGSGLGASFAILVHDQPVTALVDVTTRVTAGGFGLSLDAGSTEDIHQIAVGAGLGAGGTVSGSATIAVLTETTLAQISEEAVILTQANGRGQPNVEILARDATAVSNVSGAAALDATAGVGVGLDVVTLNKLTLARLDGNTSVQSEGSVILRAGSTEDIGSAVFTGAVGGTFAASGSASVIVQTITTLAQVEGGALVEALGNVVIEAASDGEIDIFAGAVTLGGAAGVGAGAAVPVVRRITRAEIVDGAQVRARGLLAADMIRTGAYGDSFSAPGRGDVVSSLAGNGNSGYGDQVIGDKSGKTGIPAGSDQETRDTDFDGGYRGMAGAGLKHVALPQTALRTGVLISATSSDDIATVAASAGLSPGFLAVNFSGTVASVSNDTVARIGQASVNPLDGRATGAGQSVLVLAGSDLTMLSVAAAISAASGGAVAPSAAVSFVGLRTTAEIADGAAVNALDSVIVQASSQQEIGFVGAGLALAGILGFGGTSGVVSVGNVTTGRIGAAFVVAEGSVRVGASDDTRVFGLAGSAAASGVAAVGTSVNVVMIKKDTVALIDQFAEVTAEGQSTKGTGGQALTGLDAAGQIASETGLRGVVVDARSSEDVTLVTFAGGGASFFGMGGAVAVVVSDSDTVARIAEGALVRAGDGLGQASVVVGAANDFRADLYTGAIGLGLASLAGGLSVGILRNGVDARIEGATVTADGAVRLRALSTRGLEGIVVGASGGAVALVGSVAVWNIGGTMSTGFSYQEQAPSGSGPEDAGHATGATRSGDAVNGRDWISDQDDVLGGTDKDGNGWERILDNRSQGSGGGSGRVALANGAARGSVASDGPSGTIQGAQSAGLGDIEGTTAIVTGSTITAEGALDVLAAESSSLVSVVGGATAGLVAMGGSVTVANLNAVVLASVSGEVQAGALSVRAESGFKSKSTAIAGGIGGVVLAAQAVVVNDRSVQRAEVIGGTMDIAGDSAILASRTTDHMAQTLGVTPGSLAAVGVSVALVNLSARTEAELSTQLVDVRADAGNLTVRAQSDSRLDVQSWGVGLGAIAAANGALAWAEDASSTTAHLGGVINLRGTASAEALSLSLVKSKAVAASFGVGGAFGAGVSVAILRPEVTALADAQGVAGVLSSLAVLNADAVDGTPDATRGAYAISWAASGALGLGLAGGLAIATATPLVSAITSGTAGSRLALSRAAVLSDAQALGFAAGTVGAGATLGFATTGGSVLARVSGVAEGAVTVDVLADLQSHAHSQAVTGGLFAGSFNAAISSVTTDVGARLTGQVLEGLPGAIRVTAAVSGEATALGIGTTVGLLAIGATYSMATWRPLVVAQSSALIDGSASVTVTAAQSSRTNANSGGSGGSVTVSLAGGFGGLSRALDESTVRAELGGDVRSDGAILVAATSTTDVGAKSSDRSFSVLSIGLSQAWAINRASARAVITGGSQIVAESIEVSTAGNHYARADADGSSISLLGAAIGVDVVNTIDTRSESTIGAGAVLSIAGAVRILSDNTSEGDGSAHGTVGAAVAIGATRARMSLTVTSLTLIESQAQVLGSVVTIRATGGRDADAVPANYTWSQTAEDVTNDTIRIANHGLVTGQQVMLGTDPVATWNDEGRVYSVLAVAGDPNLFRLGAAFNAFSGVNAALDRITFSTPHGFQTGDKVIYNSGAGLSIIAPPAGQPQPSALWVLVINATTIKLLDYDPANGILGKAFKVSNVNDAGNANEITITNHGFANGTLVTYHKPSAVSFNAAQVDLNSSGTAVSTGSDTIRLEDHRLQTGDRVVYTKELAGISGSGTTLGGLTHGTTYFVIRVSANAIRLATSAANATAGTAIALSTPLSNGADAPAEARQTLHKLTPSASSAISGEIGGLSEGRVYKVSVLDSNRIKLLDVVSGAVINIASTGGTNAHSLMREGVDLRARSAVQSIYIDVTSQDSGTLTGPGGQSLTDSSSSPSDGRSRLLVDGFAAGLGAGTANLAELVYDGTVSVVVENGGVPTVISGSSAVEILAQHKYDAKVNTTAGGYGLFAAGGAKAVATFTTRTLVQLGADSAAGGATALVRGGTVTVEARQVTSGGATAGSQAVAGLSFASADATTHSTNVTKISVGAATRIEGSTVRLLATTNQDLESVMDVSAGGIGVSADAGEAAAAGTRVLDGSGSFVTVMGGARITASGNLSLEANIDGSLARTRATTHSGAVGGDSDARARVEIDEEVKVSVGNGAILTGLNKVSLLASLKENRIEARGNANLTGAFGDTDSDALISGTSKSLVVVDAGASILTPDLLVSVGKGLHGLVQSASAQRNGALGDFGSANASEGATAPQEVIFNGNVTLMRKPGADVVVVIGADGRIQQLRNAVVEGGALGTDVDGDGRIVVSPIAVNADGTASFLGDAGSTLTGGGGRWTVQKGTASVTITSASAATLVLGSIDMAFDTDATTDRDISINMASHGGFTFDLVTRYDVASGSADDQRITVASAGGVELSGKINNPLGITSITAAGSILRTTAQGTITTRALALTATGSVGATLGDGRLGVEFVKAGARLPTASFAVGGNLSLLGTVSKRDASAGAVSVAVSQLQVTGSAKLRLTDAVVATTLPATAPYGVVVGATGLANGYFREFYRPDGAGTLSPDAVAVFGQASGARASTIWNFSGVSVGSVTATPVASAGTSVTINGLTPPAARMAALDTGATTAKLPSEDWTSAPMALGAIDWSGMAA